MIKITLDVTPRTKASLKECFGRGDIAGHEFALFTTIPTHSIVIEYRDQQYEIKCSDLIETFVAGLPTESAVHA